MPTARKIDCVHVLIAHQRLVGCLLVDGRAWMYGLKGRPNQAPSIARGDTRKSRLWQARLTRSSQVSVAQTTIMLSMITLVQVWLILHDYEVTMYTVVLEHGQLA
jgi:hypothetical protein